MASRNPFAYVEIPVTDVDRAISFYTAVFGYSFERTTIDGYEMALFPSAPGSAGANGALAKGDVYRPSKDGAVVYLSVPDMDAALSRAEGAGAAVLYPKTLIDGYGHVAEIEDSEGNRIALFKSVEPAEGP